MFLAGFSWRCRWDVREAKKEEQRNQFFLFFVRPKIHVWNPYVNDKNDSDAHPFVNELKEIHPQNNQDKQHSHIVIEFLVGKHKFKTTRSNLVGGFNPSEEY